MLCEKCKTNVATIHMTEIIGGNKKEVHLCEKCVEKNFIIPHFKMSLAELFKTITSGGSLSSSLDSAAAKKDAPALKEPRKCGLCQAEFDNFDLYTDLGCPNDYQIFSKPFDKILRKYNNDNSVHSGKLPLSSLEKTRKENQYMLLHMRIDNAIKKENYELAAEIRDKLKQL